MTSFTLIEKQLDPSWSCYTFLCTLSHSVHYYLMFRTGAQLLLATLAISIVPVASEIDRFLVVDYNLQDRSRHLSNLLRLTSPPTRASLLKELVCYASVHVKAWLKNFFLFFPYATRAVRVCCSVLALSCSSCITCWRWSTTLSSCALVCSPCWKLLVLLRDVSSMWSL